MLLRGNELHIASSGGSHAVLASNQEKVDRNGRRRHRQGKRSRSRTARLLSVDRNSALGRGRQPLRAWVSNEAQTFSEDELAIMQCIGGDPNRAMADLRMCTFRITDVDEFLIVATDGIWEYIEPEEAVRIVGGFLEAGYDVKEACAHLIEVAAEKWEQYECNNRDDITAIVVRFSDLEMEERSEESTVNDMVICPC